MANSSRSGDPDGRRIALRRAALLSEAQRVAKALEILLQRADVDHQLVSDLVSALARREREQLQRALGRIEPRTRFKSTGGQPLHSEMATDYLFIDESGISQPEPTNEPKFFAMGSISIADHAIQNFCQESDRVKVEFFGRTDFQFHEPFMRYRRQHNGIDYSFNDDTAKQAQFDDAISDLIRRTPFYTFGVGIRKTAFENEFVESGIDPYLPTDVYCVAITLLLERYVDHLAHATDEKMGRVVVESQGPKEDAEHQLEYARLLLEGTQWVSASTLRSRLETGIRFATKGGSDPSELADFFSRDLYEWIRGDCRVTPKWWDEFCSKVYVRGDGQMGKFSVKVFPDSDLRDKIELHRIQFGAAVPPE